MASLTILAVDDHPGEREALRSNLSARGHKVVLADSGRKAMRALGRHRPDAVVLDQRLRGETGVDVLGAIRGKDRYLPVIAFSAWADGAARAALVKGGVDFIVEKGGEAGELPDAIERVVGKTDRIVMELDRWASADPAARRRGFICSDGRVRSFREAVDEMKKDTPLGRQLLEDYRVGTARLLQERTPRRIPAGRRRR